MDRDSVPDKRVVTILLVASGTMLGVWAFLFEGSFLYPLLATISISLLLFAAFFYVDYLRGKK